jgi:hypothetical protein
MGFTNVAWESRDTEQLARDLTTGPGAMSVGQAGAAWVRVANEIASISEQYDHVVEQFKTSFVSHGGEAAANRLDEFGKWLQAASLSAAGNGQRAEEATAAYGAAVMAMPSVSEAVEARTAHDVMASLAAYNGAILNGRFAEFDEAAAAGQGNAAAVMYQYEEACEALAAPWDQPLPPDVSNGSAVAAAKAALVGGAAGVGGGIGHAVAGPSPHTSFRAPDVTLTSFRAPEVKGGSDPKALAKVGVDGGGLGSGGGAGMPAGGYGPIGAVRGAIGREHESSLGAESLDGGGEAGAGLSHSGDGWLPSAAPSDAPFTVSSVSWAPTSAVFDDLAVPDEPEVSVFADDSERTLEQVSQRWVSPPVIGADKGLTL